MATVYYSGDTTGKTVMQVLDSDVSYWATQGWTSTPASAPAPSAPPTGVTSAPDASQQYYFVKFSSDPTPTDNSTNESLPWFYSVADHTYRPFVDQASLDAFVRAAGGDPSKVSSITHTLSPADAKTGSWAGSFLSTQYSPTADGKLPAYGATSNPSAAADGRYGMQQDTTAEQATVRALSFLLIPRWTQLGILDQSSLTAITNDPATLQKYVYAQTYGGYLPQDVWRDLKIQELAKTNPAYASMKGISTTMSAADFYKTADYTKVLADPQLMPPAVTLASGENLMTYQIYHMPESFYQEPVATIDWRDPKFKAAADQIAAGFYDVALAKMEAQTTQDKAIADDNYSRYIDQINTQYHLTLSNDAEAAWNQILSLQQGFENRGVGNTGLMQEAIDKTLRERQKQMTVTRSEHVKTEDAAQRNFLLQSASPIQIHDAITKMNAEDQAAGLAHDQFRSVLWGLTPDQATSDKYSLENLKKAYPDYSDSQIQMMRDSFIDQYGNFRSQFYQTAVTNMLNNRVNKQTYQGQTQLENATKAVTKASNDMYNSDLSNLSSAESNAAEAAQANQTAADDAARKAGAGGTVDLSQMTPAASAAPAAPVAPNPTAGHWSAVSVMGNVYTVIVDGRAAGTYSDPNQAGTAARAAGNYIGSFGDMSPAQVINWATTATGQATVRSAIGTQTSTPAPVTSTAPVTTTPVTTPAPSTTSTSSSTPNNTGVWKPPAGMEIINGAIYNTTAKQQAAYSNIQTSPDKQNLYGTPISNPAATSSSTPNNTGVWKPPAGMEIINGAIYNTTAKQQAAYSNIQTSPDKQNLYGTPISNPAATSTPAPAPAPTSAQPSTSSSNPSSLTSAQAATLPSASSISPTTNPQGLTVAEMVALAYKNSG